MQAVILAAGKSTRAYPLTLTRPKPLLKAANKTLLEHNLDGLNGVVDEAIIVIGYKKDLIKAHIGDNYKELKIRYVEQKCQLGTGHALSITEPYIKGRFVLLMGDNIYSKEDIGKCAGHRYSILTANAANPQNFGVVVEKNGILADFVEKPEKFVSGLVSTALYSLDMEIFRHITKIKKSERKELELPDALKLLAKENDIYCIKSKKWLPISYAWDLLKADKELRMGKNIIGKNSIISGDVKSSSMGDNCIIKGNVRNSIIMDNTIIEEDSFVEDSVIGENVHFNGKIAAKNDAYSVVQNKKIKAGRLGAIIGDNVDAENVVIEAGCKIWPNKAISNKVVHKDVE